MEQIVEDWMYNVLALHNSLKIPKDYGNTAPSSKMLNTFLM